MTISDKCYSPRTIKKLDERDGTFNRMLKNRIWTNEEKRIGNSRCEEGCPKNGPGKRMHEEDSKIQDYVPVTFDSKQLAQHLTHGRHSIRGYSTGCDKWV